MEIININEAKINFSKLLSRVHSGEEIILSDPLEYEAEEPNEIDELLRNPIAIKSFTPLARKDIYERD